MQFARDGVHEVRFTQTDTAIKEQRVEGDWAAFGDAAGGGVGQFVGLADDEIVKAEARVKRGGAQLGVGGGFHGSRGLTRSRGRLFGGRAGLLIQGKVQTSGIGARRVDLMQDQIREVLADVVPKEICRHFECHDSVFNSAGHKRFNPGGVVVLPHRL